MLVTQSSFPCLPLFSNSSVPYLPQETQDILCVRYDPFGLCETEVDNRERNMVNSLVVNASLILGHTV